MKSKLSRAAAILCASAAMISCASVSELQGRGGRIWQERTDRIGKESADGEILCLAAGQFQLTANETVIAKDDGSVTVQGQDGEFTIHENRFDKPMPAPNGLANRDLFGAFYRYDDPRIGYIVTLANPVQEGEFVVAWIEGSAFDGDSSDSAIYSRYGFGVGSTACVN